MKSRKTTWPYHKWEYVTFSTHHGMEPPEYKCAKCHRVFKSDEDPPRGPCLIVWKDKQDSEIITILLRRMDLEESPEEQELPLEYAQRLARAILRIG